MPTFMLAYLYAFLCGGRWRSCPVGVVPQGSGRALLVRNEPPCPPCWCSPTQRCCLQLRCEALSIRIGLTVDSAYRCAAGVLSAWHIWCSLLLSETTYFCVQQIWLNNLCDLLVILLIFLAHDADIFLYFWNQVFSWILGIFSILTSLHLKLTSPVATDMMESCVRSRNVDERVSCLEDDAFSTLSRLILSL